MLQRVTLYLCQNTLGFNLGVPDIFAMASMFQQNLGGPAISIDIASNNGQPIQTFGGLEVATNTAIADVSDTQLIMLPALGGVISSHFLDQHHDLYAQLNHCHQLGVPIIAVGAANFLLAEAGLLHNRMCTANNFSRDKFKQRYSNVEVHSERSIVESDGIYTCIGNQASRYVLYYLLAQLSSEAIAKNTENTFTAELSMQAFTEGLLSDPSEAHQDEEIWRIQQWVQLHFAESISLDNLAAKANMSLRTFKRRFKQATSLAPLHYLQNLRVEQGKEFLKHTNKNVGEISRLVGYEDTGHFIRLFKRSYDKSPQQWRKHYQTA